MGWVPPVRWGKGVVEELRDDGGLAALPASQKHDSKHKQYLEFFKKMR